MTDKLEVIGLAGTNGSGKDTVGELLAQHHGYLFVSVTDILRQEVRKRGQEITRENLRAVSAEWRKEQGLGVLVDMAMRIYRSKKGYKGVVISSLRNPGEVDRVHELHGSVVWIDADSQVRYKRVHTNAKTRGREAEDNISYEQFLAEEATEMYRSKQSDETALNMSAIKDKSDIQINNDYTDAHSLQVAVEEALKLTP
jgi:dephospho-CoA kinase